MRERIEAVTVCVGYGDFLAETAKFNAGLLDRWIIVTDESDEETREMCRVHDLECVLSSDHKRDGPFNKGRMVDRGIEHLSSNAWRLHLDCDIVLPHRFRNVIEGAHLDSSKLYGADRIMVESWDEWQALQRSGWINHTHCSCNFPSNHRIGTRYALAEQGYIPIGYFQLWHSATDEWRGRRIRKYPTLHGEAHRTDVQFALHWDRQKRELLPEFLVVHLASQKAKLGANWQGRTTVRFGPEVVPLTSCKPS